MLDFMDIMNRLNSTKRVCFLSAAILGATILAVFWVTGCVQQTQKTTQAQSPPVTSSSAATVSPLTAQQQQPIPVVELQNQLIEIQKTLSRNIEQQTNQFSGQYSVQVLDLENQLINFQKNLTESVKNQADHLDIQADKHRELLEFYYKMTLGFLAFCGGIVTFFLAKNLHETKSLIRASIHSAKLKAEAEIQNSIANAMAQFNEALGKNRSDAQIAVKKLQDDYTHDRRIVIWLSSVISRAYVVLSHLNHSTIQKHDENTSLNNERKEVIYELKNIQIQWAPTNRTVAIVLGRLYRLARQYDEAFNELEEVLKIMDPKDKDFAQDRSDFLYNQACYLNLKANEIKEQNEAWKTLKKRALETLQKSAEFCPDNLHAAKNDPDLKDLV